MSHTIREIGYFGNIFVRQIDLSEPGDIHPGERHYFDHVSLVTQGQIRCEWRDPDGTTGTEFYAANTPRSAINMPATRWHTLIAITPATTWCLFAVRDAEGLVVLDRSEANPVPTYKQGAVA